MVTEKGPVAPGGPVAVVAQAALSLLTPLSLRMELGQMRPGVQPPCCKDPACPTGARAFVCSACGSPFCKASPRDMVLEPAGRMVLPQHWWHQPGGPWSLPWPGGPLRPWLDLSLVRPWYPGDAPGGWLGAEEADSAGCSAGLASWTPAHPSQAPGTGWGVPSLNLSGYFRTGWKLIQGELPVSPSGWGLRAVGVGGGAAAGTPLLWVSSPRSPSLRGGPHPKLGATPGLPAPPPHPRRTPAWVLWAPGPPAVPHSSHSAVNPAVCLLGPARPGGALRVTPNSC